MRGKRVLMVMAALVVLCGARFAAADDPLTKEEGKLEHKEIIGQVMGVSAYGISLEYRKSARGSYEMLLPFDEKTRLDRIASLKQLKVGDTVKVEYDQRVKEDEKGKRQLLMTIATRVTFVKPAQAEEGLSSNEQVPQ
jgi:hypothetical protein